MDNKNNKGKEMKTGKYYQISYEGKDLMEIWAYSPRQAKNKAIRHYQYSGCIGMNLPRLEANQV